MDGSLEDALFRSEPAVADDGFSDRVLARLPVQRSRRSVHGRLTLAAAAAAGSLLTIALAPPVESAFGWLALSSGLRTLVLTGGAFVAVVAIPLVWLFRSAIGATLAWLGLALPRR